MFLVVLFVTATEKKPFETESRPVIGRGKMQEGALMTNEYGDLSGEWWKCFLNHILSVLKFTQLINPRTVSEFSDLQIAPGRERKGRERAGKEKHSELRDHKLGPGGEAPGWWSPDTEGSQEFILKTRMQPSQSKFTQFQVHTLERWQS